MNRIVAEANCSERLNDSIDDNHLASLRVRHDEAGVNGSKVAAANG
jgi:hypothetical protein